VLVVADGVRGAGHDRVVVALEGREPGRRSPPQLGDATAELRALVGGEVTGHGARVPGLTGARPGPFATCGSGGGRPHLASTGGGSVDIGKPRRIITVEPDESPATEPLPVEPQDEPVPAAPNDRRTVTER
jgi:hypothetical protein